MDSMLKRVEAEDGNMLSEKGIVRKRCAEHLERLMIRKLRLLQLEGNKNY